MTSIGSPTSGTSRTVTTVPDNCLTRHPPLRQGTEGDSTDAEGREGITILDLPADVLLHVFESLDIQRSWASFRDALVVSHVCSRWRSLAVAHCPFFWTKFALLIPPRPKWEGRTSLELEGWQPYSQHHQGTGGSSEIDIDHASRRRRARLDVTHPDLGVEELEFDFGRELLLRCHHSALEVGWDQWSIDIATRRPSYHIISALKFSHRFHSYMHMIPRDEIFNYAVLDALEVTRPAPHLRELRLAPYNYDMTVSSPLLPHTMFGGDLSSLQRLELRTCWLDMAKYNIGENLTSLTTVLDGTHEDRFQGVPTTMEAWLPVLNGLPNLRKLSIEQHYPCTGSISPNVPTMPVSLNRLEHLKLKLRLSHLEVFLKHVTIPASAQVCLKLYNVQSDTRFRPALAELIRRQVPPSNNNGNALSIRACDEQGIYIGFATDADARSLTIPRMDKICLHLRVRTCQSPVPEMAPYLSPMLWAWLPIIKHMAILHVVPTAFSLPCVQVIEEVMAVMPELKSLICPLPLMEALPSVDSVDGKHRYRHKASLELLTCSCYKS